MKITVSELKNMQNNIATEQSNFNSGSFSSFNGASLSSGGHPALAAVVAKIEQVYARIQAAYSSTNSWLSNYISNVEDTENGLIEKQPEPLEEEVLTFETMEEAVNYFKEQGVKEEDLNNVMNGTITLNELVEKFNFDKQIASLKEQGVSEQDIARVKNGEITIEGLINELNHKAKIQQTLEKAKIRRELEGLGVKNDDIDDLVTGLITPDELFDKINNSPEYSEIRKDNMIESYLTAFEIGVSDLDGLAQKKDVAQSELVDLVQSKENFAESKEYNSMLDIVGRLQTGEDLQYILDTEIVAYKYVNENGETCYRYDDPLASGVPAGDITYEPVRFEEMYQDSKLLDDLKEVLTTQTVGIFNKRDVLRWNNTEEQSEFIDTLGKLMQERDNVLKEFDNKISEKQQEVGSYEYIDEFVNREVNYYIDNVDSYAIKDDFNEKSNFNTGSIEVLDKIEENSFEGTTTDVYVVNNKKDLVDIINCAVNGECSNISGNVAINGRVYDLKSSDGLLENSLEWASSMTEQEKNTFNYIYNTEGFEKAYEFLEKSSDILDERWLENKIKEDQAFATDAPVLASIYSVIGTPVEGIKAAVNSVSALVNDEEIRRVDVHSSGNIYRGTVSQNIANGENGGKGLAFIYDTGMSIADTGLLIATGVATGGGAIVSTVSSAALMGSRSYVSTLNDALDRGLDDKKAVLMATGSAVTETAMESLAMNNLLNLEENIGKLTVNSLSNMSNQTLQKAYHIAAGTATQGLCEGIEEYNTEQVNYLLDNIINGDNSSKNIAIKNYMSQGYSEERAIELAKQDYQEQKTQAFVGGFASGLFFGSTQSTSSAIKYNNSYSSELLQKSGLSEAQSFAELASLSPEEFSLVETKVNELKQNGAENIDIKKVIDESKVIIKIKEELEKTKKDSIFKNRKVDTKQDNLEVVTEVTDTKQENMVFARQQANETTIQQNDNNINANNNTGVVSEVVDAKQESVTVNEQQTSQTTVQQNNVTANNNTGVVAEVTDTKQDGVIVNEQQTSQATVQQNNANTNNNTGVVSEVRDTKQDSVTVNEQQTTQTTIQQNNANTNNNAGIVNEVRDTKQDSVTVNGQQTNQETVQQNSVNNGTLVQQSSEVQNQNASSENISEKSSVNNVGVTAAASAGVMAAGAYGFAGASSKNEQGNNSSNSNNYSSASQTTSTRTTNNTKVAEESKQRRNYVSSTSTNNTLFETDTTINETTNVNNATSMNTNQLETSILNATGRQLEDIVINLSYSQILDLSSEAITKIVKEITNTRIIYNLLNTVTNPHIMNTIVENISKSNISLITDLSKEKLASYLSNLTDENIRLFNNKTNSLFDTITLEKITDRDLLNAIFKNIDSNVLNKVINNNINNKLFKNKINNLTDGEAIINVMDSLFTNRNNIYANSYLTSKLSLLDNQNLTNLLENNNILNNINRRHLFRRLSQEQINYLSKNLEGTVKNRIYQELKIASFYDERVVKAVQFINNQMFSMFNDKFSKYFSVNELRNKINGAVKFVEHTRFTELAETLDYMAFFNPKLGCVIDLKLSKTEGFYSNIVHEMIHKLATNINGSKSGLYSLSNPNILGMNEAVTEYLTYQLFGNENMIPSGYEQAMNKISELIDLNIINNEMLMDSYFGNKPNLLKQRIDSIGGIGTFDTITELFNDMISKNKFERQKAELTMDKLTKELAVKQLFMASEVVNTETETIIDNQNVNIGDLGRMVSEINDEIVSLINDYSNSITEHHPNGKIELLKQILLLYDKYLTNSFTNNFVSNNDYLLLDKIRNVFSVAIEKTVMLEDLIYIENVLMSQLSKINTANETDNRINDINIENIFEQIKAKKETIMNQTMQTMSAVSNEFNDDKKNILLEINSEIMRLTKMADSKGISLKEMANQKNDKPIPLSIQNISEKLSSEVYERAEIAEVKITQDMKSLEKDNVRLIGLEHRLKSKNSLSRKIFSDYLEKINEEMKNNQDFRKIGIDISLEEAIKIYGNNISLEQIVQGIGDSVRYTLLIDNDSYTDSVDQCLKNLISMGYKIAFKNGKYKVKNFWGGTKTKYQGINASIIDKNGVAFEIQFHTKASLLTKEELTHIFYEIERNKFCVLNERKLANKIQILYQALVPIPINAKEYKFEI